MIGEPSIPFSWREFWISEVAALPSAAVLTSTSVSIYNDPNLHRLNLKIRAQPNILNLRGSELQRDCLTVYIFLKSLLNLSWVVSVEINHLGLYTTMTLQRLFEKQLDPWIVNPVTQDVQKVGYLVQVAHGEVQAMH